MASPVSAVGRFLFAVLFLASGIQKIITYEHGGGPVLSLTSSKLTNTFDHVEKLTGFHAPFTKEHHEYMLIIAIFLETAGSLLFLFDSKIGAYLLMWFLMAVTPVVHDFWNVGNAEVQQVEAAMFLKNVALFGALLIYVAKPSKVKLA